MAEQKPPESAEAEKGDSHLSTLVALLIAIVSVSGAVVTWRASVSADGAGDADVAGIRATINLTEANTLATVNGYSDYASFLDYYKYRETGTLLEDEISGLTEDADEAEIAAMGKELADNHDLTTAASSAFPNEYLNRDGTYAIARETGEYVANAARERDTNPQPNFDEADALRAHTDQLLVTLSVLVVALVFYTLIEATDSKRLKYLLLVMGTGIFLAGLVGAFLVESGSI
ncbi:MAG: hypothetical protein LCI00_32840 [Chloroflexi bacterium]|nr:hypothetical protein [Chloroflexota bacterium]MCC6895471.1 hypothetical protein [Anaerolineae bacterium]